MESAPTHKQKPLPMCNPQAAAFEFFNQFFNQGLFIQRELLRQLLDLPGDLVLLVRKVKHAVCDAVGDRPSSRAGPMPRVVTAGVPMRTPLVTNGLRFSPGTVFLLAVMCTSSRRCSSSLPVMSIVAQVDQHQVVVRAAGHQVDAPRRSARLASALAFSTICCW